MFPFVGSTTRHLLSSAGFPEPEFPWFHGTMRCSDFLPSVSPHFVSFAWRYHSAHVFRPHAAERCRGRVSWSWSPGISRRELSVETAGSPTFLGNPNCALALLFDPGGTTHQAMQCVGAAPAVSTTKAPAFRTFEAQSHGFGTGCLRFAGRVAPTPRKTRFRLLARLFRTGLITRRVPSKGFTVYPTSNPPFPSSTSCKDKVPNSQRLAIVKHRWAHSGDSIATKIEGGIKIAVRLGYVRIYNTDNFAAFGFRVGQSAVDFADDQTGRIAGVGRANCKVAHSSERTGLRRPASCRDR